MPHSLPQPFRTKDSSLSKKHHIIVRFSRNKSIYIYFFLLLKKQTGAWRNQYCFKLSVSTRRVERFKFTIRGHSCDITAFNSNNKGKRFGKECRTIIVFHSPSVFIALSLWCFLKIIKSFKSLSSYGYEICRIMTLNRQFNSILVCVRASLALNYISAGFQPKNKF